MLRSNATDDKVLFDEYDVVYDDLNEIVSNYISGFTSPEKYKSTYIYMGGEKVINRKAAFSGLLSNICDDLYSDTPIINNEAINRNEITPMANNSRNKIVAG